MFGISNNVRSREVRECTPELFWKAVRSPLVADICAQIADGLEKVKRGEMVKEDYETLKAGLKKRLPIFTPHATFRNGRRLNADAVPSGLSMYDIDHLPNPREYWGMKSEELRMKNVLRFVVLAHITPSTEGLRLFFIIPDGMDLAGAQKWMSEQLGDANYDQSVKDLARSSFVVPEDYIIYVDEERLFKNEELKMKNEELKMKNEESPCHAGLSDDNRRGVSHTPECVNENASGDAHVDDKADVSGRMQYAPTEMAFKGIPYSDIIARWFTLTGGEPVQGERNDKLHRLASHLRYITDNNEEILLQIMPRYGLSEEEMKGLIHSACSAKWYSMPKLMKEACRGVSHTPECTNENANGDVCADVSGRMRYAPTVPPELPKKLPKLIGLLVSRTPDVYKPAVAHAVFPPLATHLHKVRFKYIDNVEHEATLMNVLMAGTGAGR